MLLWRYIDGECNPIELEQIEKQLETDPEFFEEYMLCLQLHAKFNKIHQRKGRKKEINESIDLSFLDDVEMKYTSALATREANVIKFFTSTFVALLWLSGFQMFKYIYALSFNMSFFETLLYCMLISFICIIIPIGMYVQGKKRMLIN